MERKRKQHTGDQHHLSKLARIVPSEIAEMEMLSLEHHSSVIPSTQGVQRVPSSEETPMSPKMLILGISNIIVLTSAPGISFDEFKQKRDQFKRDMDEQMQRLDFSV